MKRAFVLTDGVLASALVPAETRDLLNLGDRLSLRRPLALDSGASISAGARGTVAWKDTHTGAVDVLMDTPHASLSAWDNHLTLEPYGTEDILDCGVAFARRRVPAMPRWLVPVGIAVLLAASCAVLNNVLYADPFHMFSLWEDFNHVSSVFTRVFLITVTAATSIVSLR